MTSIAVLTVTLFATQAPDNPGRDLALLQAVADAFDENLAKFPFGTAEFEFSDGFATSVEAAARAELKDGRWRRGNIVSMTKHTSSSKGVLARGLFATSSWSSPEQGSSRLDSERMMTNGKVTFTERIGCSPDGKQYIYGHIITPGTADFFRMADFPLQLGWPEESRDDLAHSIRMVLSGSAGTGVGTIQQDAKLDGVKVVQISLSFPNGMVQYSVDLERGAIPLHRHGIVTGGFTYDVAYGNIRLVKGHGWLPFEKTTFDKTGRTKRLVITSADFDTRPRQSFQLETEQARSIANVAAGVSYSPRKRWDLDNLPSASGPAARRLQVAGDHANRDANAGGT